MFSNLPLPRYKLRLRASTLPSRLPGTGLACLRRVCNDLGFGKDPARVGGEALPV